jgi:AcrR family transcriptional regulator
VGEFEGRVRRARTQGDVAGGGTRRMTEPVRVPRHYDSPLRQQQAADTRERIVTAGCEVLRTSSIRNWRALTIRGVAQQAGVNERTVYRYFTNERGLRDAVMHRLEQDAGVELDGMRLEDISQVAARIFGHASLYPPAPKPPLDPTLSEANLRQRNALHDALAQWTAGWPTSDRASAAAIFDVLWSLASYERLAVDWQMDRDQAVRTLTWAIGLIAEAVRSGQQPSLAP